MFTTANIDVVGIIVFIYLSNPQFFFKPLESFFPTYLKYTNL